MPLRIPATPRSAELLTFAGAGALALTPLSMAVPGATERVASQTARWAPRWERNVSYFVPPAEGTARRVSPPIERTVKRLGDRLPLGAVAKTVDRRIRGGIGRFGGLHG